MMRSLFYDADEYERIVELLSEHPDVLVPADYMKTKIVPSIALVVLLLTLLYNIYFPIINNKKSSSNLLKTRKATYQLTNFSVNIVLGALGTYEYLYTLPSKPILDDYIVGSYHLYPLVALQIGFQLWALPVGVLVRETPAMMAHHVATIFVSCMAGFLTFGFRYWSPFFFGMIELSSVPLAIMNTFKDNPEWMKSHPQLYLLVRSIFSASFLYLRWVMYMPRKFMFLRHAAMVIYASDHAPFRIYMSCVWLASALLAILQFWWGLLVLKGIIKFLFFKKKKRSSTKENGKEE